MQGDRHGRGQVALRGSDLVCTIGFENVWLDGLGDNDEEREVSAQVFRLFLR